MRGHLDKCPYMTGVPSSQVHFNVKVHFGSQKMKFRHPDRCPLVTGFSVCPHDTWARARILDTVANLATHFQKL